MNKISFCKTLHLEDLRNIYIKNPKLYKLLLEVSTQLKTENELSKLIYNYNILISHPMNLKTLIKTDKSSLLYGIFPNKLLVKSCVDDSVTKLIERPQIKIFGKVARQNRNVGFFSDTSKGYHYSNQFAKSIPLTDNLRILIKIINYSFKSNFNGILINYYADGDNTIGAHSDDEKYLDKSGVISLSHGASRIFRIRNKKTKKIVKDIILKDMSIVHMEGDFQKEFTHEIPKESKVKTPRVSFTFRKHII